ncbi:uridylate kinase [Methylobacterium nonmethylotrophicum]|uniref:Uridylate kinase n=1 Tax=Methylobacterium nonmethylotrophicum TaxID=1141884 RepID=A0A4Z0NK76_9HYPH|nr:uridylate kinase [Methylobacterium nonmethylotrophicum]TGD96032.1 uridylate kinase [Methylobacterium nonmethylotrophicum]
MSLPLTVVKIGGSLVADGARLRRLLGALPDGVDGPVAIVPGGGALADAVRATQAALAFPDPLAHRLAIGAMAGMARIFAALEPRLAVTEDPVECLAAGGVPVWDPSALAAGHPEIPESWDVTSDSLALWLAARLCARTCLLVKSADPAPGAGPAELARAGLVDAAFPGFATRFSGAIVLRGPGGDRLCRDAVACPEALAERAA